MVDRGGLENRYTFGYPGFESLSLRKRIKSLKTSAEAEVFFMPKGGREFTHYATFRYKKQRSEGACRLFVSLQGPLRQAAGDGQA